MNYFYYFFPDIIDEYEDYHNELRSYINKNKKLGDKIAILEKGNP